MAQQAVLVCEKNHNVDFWISNLREVLGIKKKKSFVLRTTKEEFMLPLTLFAKYNLFNSSHASPRSTLSCLSVCIGAERCMHR